MKPCALPFSVRHSNNHFEILIYKILLQKMAIVPGEGCGEDVLSSAPHLRPLVGIVISKMLAAILGNLIFEISIALDNYNRIIKVPAL